MRVGTRLYLTRPEGERVGFTFKPQVHSIPGLTYYTPYWEADAGVDYQLQSKDALLTLAGNSLYELKTARAYNPADSFFEGYDYTLTASDGTIYHISTANGVQEQITPLGTHLIYSDSGITSSTGETIRWVHDQQQRLTQITAPDGEQIVYSYDDAGNLVADRNLALGESQRYGYSSIRELTLAVSPQAGEAISYNSTTPQTSPVRSDLGSASGFNGASTSGNLVAGATDRYSFSLRPGELQSTATDVVLLGIEVDSNSALLPAIPIIDGLTPLATSLDGDRASGLFAVSKSGLNLIELSGTNNGTYSLQLTIAGDLNLDGLVDGSDGELLTPLLASRAGDSQYTRGYDLNRDGTINATDMQILGSNYSFVANRAPVVTPTAVLTHVDLETDVDLAKLATDPEGDAVFYRLVNPVGGKVAFSPDGQNARFLPTAGFAGTASFGLIADDGYSSSLPATVTVNVSSAPLVNLDLVERNPRLQVGESSQLVAIGDFADQEDVILPSSYVTFASENPTVALVSNTGTVTGSSNGTTILSVAKNGLQAVTAARVGISAPPTNDAEFNLALAETMGLDVYPQAITLVEGVTRQLSVGVNDALELLNLDAAATGTRYFVSNPQVLQVNSDGLITALDEGVAAVTIVHGAAELVVPVRVELPQLDTATLGVNGGVVQASDGAMVMVAPGALEENTTVSIGQISQAELTLAIPENFSFAGAFKLDVGDDPLAVPVQLALPAPEGLTPGTEVFFVRKEELPDTTGAMKPIWMMEESGVVGADGMIRTASPPWKGAYRSGEYSLVIPNFEYSVEHLLLAVAAYTAGAFLIAAGIAIELRGGKFKVGVKLDPIVAGLGLSFVVAPLLLEAAEKSVTVLTVPTVGLPYTTEAGVNINPGQLCTLTGYEPVPKIPEAVAITRVDVAVPEPQAGAEDQVVGRVIYLTGNNFGTSIDDLSVNFHFGGQVYTGNILPEAPGLTELNQSQIAVTSDLVPYGEAQVSVVRKLKSSMGTEQTLETKPAEIPVERRVELAVSPQVWDDKISIINARNPESVIADTSSKDLLLASIPVGTPEQEDAPRYVAVTHNASRAYVPLEGSGRVAVVDLMGLHQLDTNPTDAGINPIELPTGAEPSTIAIEPNDRYAYIADRQLGAIYVLDINPYSTTYNQLLQTIHVGPTNTGLRQLAISSDGRKLFATTRSGSSSGKGQIFIVNIDPQDRPENLARNPRLWHQQIAAIEADSMTEGIAATPNNPRQMVFTNRGNEARGFGVLTIENDDPLELSAKITYAELNLGSYSDYFDVNDAYATTVTSDGEYAFVAGFNGRNLGLGGSIDGPKAGSNVGIIKLQDASGQLAPQLVAATRPIPMGLTSHLALSSNDKYLYASYPGVGSTFGFSVEEILLTLNSPAVSGQLSSKPIDDINPYIDMAADVQILRDDWLSRRYVYGVPLGSRNGPIATGGNPFSVAMASTSPQVNIVSPGEGAVVSSLTPTFQWDVSKSEDCGDDGCDPIPEDPNNIKEVNLYVSVFDTPEGLKPDDRWLGLQPVKAINDYNPNRILTVKWKDGVWRFDNGQIVPEEEGYKYVEPDEFKLPSQRMLTAGQTYYWAVEVVKQNGEREPIKGQFKTLLPKPAAGSNTFSSITILTRGLELRGDEADSQFETMADSITKAGDGLVIHYDSTRGQWYRNTDSGRDYNLSLNKYYGKPLVLIPGWEYQKESAWNTGFAEAAADTLFASLVQLDQSLEGNVGKGNQLYDPQGKSTLR